MKSEPIVRGNNPGTLAVGIAAAVPQALAAAGMANGLNEHGKLPGGTTTKLSEASRQAPARQSEAAAEPPLGAHLVTQRRGYSHHGIYVGNARVVHYAGLCSQLHAGPIEELSLEHFGAGHDIQVRAEPLPRYTGDEAVRRARSRLGENRYRLLSNNCEHFCTWCLYGEAHSEQVRQSAIHPMRALRALGSLLSVWWDSRPRVIPTAIFGGIRVRHAG